MDEFIRSLPPAEAKRIWALPEDARIKAVSAYTENVLMDDVREIKKKMSDLRMRLHYLKFPLNDDLFSRVIRNALLEILK